MFVHETEIDALTTEKGTSAQLGVLTMHTPYTGSLTNRSTRSLRNSRSDRTCVPRSVWAVLPPSSEKCNSIHGFV
jgi:hypothetical protein